MILQALNEYYERKDRQGTNELSKFGFEEKKIPITIELDTKGNLIQIKPLDKDSVSTEVVPKSVKRASKITANLLWDNAEYALGLDTRDQLDRVKKQHEAFKEKIKSLPEPAASDEGVLAVLAFLSNLDVNEKEESPRWKEHWEQLQKNPNVGFQLQSDTHLVCQRNAVIDTIESSCPAGNSSLCLVTGKQDQIARLHHPIKGVWNAQGTGANIVSFNKKAFESFNKEQGDNAPVGEQACFSYTTALNHLLKSSENRFQVGDASTVFWSEIQSDFESNFGITFSQSSYKDNPDMYTEAVKAIYRSVNKGRMPANDTENIRFYVLGLSPNASRIAIRFWIVDTIRSISRKIKQHFDDTKIAHGPKESPYLPLHRLLANTAVQYKSDNIPPNLGGEVIRSILNGSSYPYTILAAAVRRCKAEQSVNYPRAAIIKAYLNRANRLSNQEEEISMALDKQCNNPAYCLGRLFSCFVKLQEDAQPGINATISDRYYGAASSNPATVFPTLIRLHKHHLAKLDSQGKRIYYEKLIGEILGKLPAKQFPANFSMQNQGYFAVGFYHQRQDFFTKRDTQQPEGE